jgi:hypothetical protein
MLLCGCWLVTAVTTLTGRAPAAGAILGLWHDDACHPHHHGHQVSRLGAVCIGAACPTLREAMYVVNACSCRAQDHSHSSFYADSAAEPATGLLWAAISAGALQLVALPGHWLHQAARHGRLVRRLLFSASVKDVAGAVAVDHGSMVGCVANLHADGVTMHWLQQRSSHFRACHHLCTGATCFPDILWHPPAGEHCASRQLLLHTLCTPCLFSCV